MSRQGAHLVLDALHYKVHVGGPSVAQRGGRGGGGAGGGEAEEEIAGGAHFRLEIRAHAPVEALEQVHLHKGTGGRWVVGVG